MCGELLFDLGDVLREPGDFSLQRNDPHIGLLNLKSKLDVWAHLFSNEFYHVGRVPIGPVVRRARAWPLRARAHE